MTLGCKKEATCWAAESNFPSFIVKLCNYCSTFHLSSCGSWMRPNDLAYSWQKQKTNMGLQRRQTAHERTNHTTETEIKPKHTHVKPDSPISLHALVEIVSSYCLLVCLVHWLTIQNGIGMNLNYMTSRSHCFKAALVACVFICRCYIGNLFCHLFLAYIFDTVSKQWKLQSHYFFSYWGYFMFCV